MMTNKKSKLCVSIMVCLIICNLVFYSTPISTLTSDNYLDNDKSVLSTSDTATVTIAWQKTFSDYVNTVKISADGSNIALINGSLLEYYNNSSNIPMWTFDAGASFWGMDMSADGKFIVLRVGDYIYLFGFSRGAFTVFEATI